MNSSQSQDTENLVLPSFNCIFSTTEVFMIYSTGLILKMETDL